MMRRALGFGLPICLLAGMIQFQRAGAFQPLPSRNGLENSVSQHDGETIVNGNKVDLGEQSIEILGICKIDESGPGCWTADGAPAPEVSQRLLEQLQKNSNGFMSSFQFQFGKKNRLLILKHVTQPFDPHKAHKGYGYGLDQSSYDRGQAEEGWSNSGNTMMISNSSDLSVPRDEWQIVVGSFNFSTRTWPVRYQFTAQEGQAQVIPLKEGQIKSDGNVYTLDSWSDKPPKGGSPQNPYMFGSGNVPFKFTYLNFHVDSIADKNAILNIYPANAKGEPYLGFNKKGEPLTQLEWQRYLKDQQKNVWVNDGSRTIFPLGMVEYIQFDPRIEYRDKSRTGRFNVAPSFVKKLRAYTLHRTVYRFNNVQLDPHE